MMRLTRRIERLPTPMTAEDPVPPQKCCDIRRP